MKRDYTLFLKDIISAIESVEEFVEGMSLEELAKDDKTSSAVIRKFEVIGEAAKHLPDKLKQKHSEIPWKKIVGMRDRLIHAYFGIDFKLVWEVIRIELPLLRSKLKKVLTELERQNKKIAGSR